MWRCHLLKMTSICDQRASVVRKYLYPFSLYRNAVTNIFVDGVFLLRYYLSALVPLLFRLFSKLCPWSYQRTCVVHVFIYNKSSSFFVFVQCFHPCVSVWLFIYFGTRTFINTYRTVGVCVCWALIELLRMRTTGAKWYYLLVTKYCPLHHCYNPNVLAAVLSGFLPVPLNLVGLDCKIRPLHL